MFLPFLFAASVDLFAQNSNLVPQGLTTLGTNILGVFTGPLVKTILMCFLAGCGVAYAFNKDNEKMKRNIIAIGIGIAIITGATFIVDAVFTASS